MLKVKGLRSEVGGYILRIWRLEVRLKMIEVNKGQSQTEVSF